LQPSQFNSKLISGTPPPENHGTAFLANIVLFTNAKSRTPGKLWPALLMVSWWLVALTRTAPTQQTQSQPATQATQSQPTPAQPTPAQPASNAPPQSGSGNSSTTQNQQPAAPPKQTALNNPLLVETDEERNLTAMEPRIEFEYRYDRFDGRINGDMGTITWLQSFGSAQRLAAGIELPISYQSAGGPGEHSATGIDDITLQFRGMLSKGEKFEQAAGIEVTVPLPARRWAMAKPCSSSAGDFPDNWPQTLCSTARSATTARWRTSALSRT
jgi:hypothetical protein